MNAIKATWTNGQILPAGPVDWPEGSELLVEPVISTEKIGLDENDWQDDAESIADWIAWVDMIEPMEMTNSKVPGLFYDQLLTKQSGVLTDQFATSKIFGSSSTRVRNRKNWRSIACRAEVVRDARRLALSTHNGARVQIRRKST